MTRQPPPVVDHHAYGHAVGDIVTTLGHPPRARGRWVRCEGQRLWKRRYPELTVVLRGAHYGPFPFGGGRFTMRLPDMRPSPDLPASEWIRVR
jgi:microcystin-dependent protein